MADNKDPGWPDFATFHENNSKVPPEVFLAHAGQYVAWSLDGSRILASGPDRETLDRRLEEAGIGYSEVVHGYIDEPDVSNL